MFLINMPICLPFSPRCSMPYFTERPLLLFSLRPLNYHGTGGNPITAHKQASRKIALVNIVVSLSCEKKNAVQHRILHRIMLTSG